MSTTGNARAHAPTPAQLYALVFGAVLLLVGILGFFANADFGNLGSNVNGDELIAFEVNGWHNIVHAASGLLGLLLWRSATGARAFALGFGVVYLVVTVYGFVTGDHILGLLPVNAADNVLHLLIALIGVGAGLASGPAPAAHETRPTAA